MATLAELCIVACADAFRGSGEVIATGIGPVHAARLRWRKRMAPSTQGALRRLAGNVIDFVRIPPCGTDSAEHQRLRAMMGV
jgi:hypothetical protein